MWPGYARTPGSTDEQVLARATAEGRVLVTADKDFGDLVFGAGRGVGSGVILLRLRGSISTWAAALAAAGERDDWTGVFAVVTEGGTARGRCLATGSRRAFAAAAGCGNGPHRERSG